MRLSRNRNWGNPHLVRFIKRLGNNAKKVGWNGLLVGDMAQPRGGPMLSGHTSHQVGLDVDIWFTPMPGHVQSREEREFASATNVVAPDLRDVDTNVWTHTYTELIRTAAQDPPVTRIFVNAAIKKALCREAERSAIGWRRCGRGGATPNIFMSALPVRPTVPNASRNRRPRRATAAVMNSTSGSDRRCIQRRRSFRPNQNRH